MAAIGGAGDESCGNCGRPGDHLEEVRRVYLTVDEHGRVTGGEESDAVERWCGSCRSLYPHRAVGS